MQEIITVKAPGSKSVSHRALVCAALAAGESVIGNLPENDDVLVTLAALRKLGAQITRMENGLYKVRGLGGAPRNPSDAPLDLDMGESGSSSRLLSAVAALGQGSFLVRGGAGLSRRPMLELAAALRALGAEARFLEGEGHLPLLIRGIGGTGEGGPDTPQGRVTVSADESSQFLSGLLLAAPLYCGAGGLEIELGGSAPVSRPYIGLTLRVMEDFGVSAGVEVMDADGGWRAAGIKEVEKARPGALRFKVPGMPYQARDYRVEGDWSGAACLLAAGAIGPRPVRVSGLRRDSAQGDRAILEILENMGAETGWDGDAALAGPGTLRAVELDMGDVPDLAPVAAALAAHARAPSRIYNAAHLRLKESDRLAALGEELVKAGCMVYPLPDGMVLVPPQDGLYPPRPGTVFCTHGDHRLAMSLCLLGLKVGGSPGFRVELDDPGCVSKSFPNFWEVWAKIADQGSD